MKMKAKWLAAVLLSASVTLAAHVSLADGPQDNSVINVRPIPPVGIELTVDQLAEIRSKQDELVTAIDELKASQSEFTQQYLPDVEIFSRAVSQAVEHRELYNEREIADALALLEEGLFRADELKQKRAPWNAAHGLVLRGFRSSLDGTVQPYGLEIAEDYDFEHPQPCRCDLWFHGRGERSLEVQFISQRMKKPGQYPPATGIVLHPYGRYSNAFKFAGEVDVYEALQHLKQNYNIDDDKISVRGFSMGGAGCWQFAVHDAGRWFAANPGAGFSETPQFLKTFQDEILTPTWYEEKLWRLYDCNLWAENLQQVPTIAYSGEIDRQKQAADVMEAALAELNIDLMHVIGPETAHKIHPESNALIRRKMDSLAVHGRQRYPKRIAFTTYTLKYNRMHWLTVHGLKEHWEKSLVLAEITEDGQIHLTTDGITEFSLDFPAGSSPFDLRTTVDVIINGQYIGSSQTKTDRSFRVRFHLVGEQWKKGAPQSETLLKKRHGLQGPIDDAFMSPFLFVRPSGDYELPQLRDWTNSELERAVNEWRRQMRGDVRIKADHEVTDDDIAKYNLILWGTPQTNLVMRKVAEKLPVKWTWKNIEVSQKVYDSQNHTLAMIHPNPLNTNRYVVFNSSFTYREYDYLNNARQTPKLPDWAVIDIQTPPSARWPGKIVDAGFFDEHWKLKEASPR